MKSDSSKMVREAYQALRTAVAKALAEHRRLGNPVYLWRKGKVVRVPAHRLRPRSMP
jgi:hypothetical protein